MSLIRVAICLVTLHGSAFAAMDTTKLLVPDKPKPKQALSCSDPQSIRDFKDVILAELNPEAKWADSDARCVCGKAADKAGRNKPPPPQPTSVPKFPGFDAKIPDASMKEAKAWYKQYLPVNDAQAAKLAQCAYGESYANAKSKTEKK